MNPQEFVKYVIKHEHEIFCELCGKWHANQDTYKPCCYDYVSKAGTLNHICDLAKTVNQTNNYDDIPFCYQDDQY